MWPLNQLTTLGFAKHVLVLTRHRALLYSTPKARQPDTWQLVCEQAISPDLSPVAAASSALHGLFAQVQTQCKISVLLDSYWAPVSLIQIGDSILGKEQIHALSLHRFKSYFGAEVEQWLIQSSYRVGEHQFSAYGVPQQLINTINESANEHRHIKISELAPTFSWVWDQVWSHQVRPAKQGWMILMESDRCIVGKLTSNQLVALHPALPHLPGTTNALKALTKTAATEMATDATDMPIHFFDLCNPDSTGHPLLSRPIELAQVASA